MRYLPAALVALVVAVVLPAGPAGAHPVDGVDAGNYRTRVLATTPAVPGLEVEAIENGHRLQVTNRTGQTVVVAGYEGEPYLRLGPDGVEENLRSPATYLNRDEDGDTPVPDHADAEADPEWSRIGGGDVARWHDHRTHWMGSDDPPAVRRAPDREHRVIPEWVVPLRVGATTVEVTGDVLWVPGPDPLPWYLLGAGLFTVTVAAAGFGQARRIALGVALTVVLLADLVRTLGIGFAHPGDLGDRVAHTLSVGFLTPVVWGAGLVGLALVARGREAGWTVTAVVGLFVAADSGVAELQGLGRSQLVFAWSDPVFRAGTVTALGVGTGLLVAAGLALYRAPTPEGPAPGVSDSGSTSSGTAVPR